MKLYLVIVVTLLFSSLLRAEEDSYFPGPNLWEDNFDVLDHNFKNYYVRTSYAPAGVPSDKIPLLRSLTVHVPFGKLEQKGKMDGKVIFDVEYDVKEYGFRETPEELYQKPAKTHLIVAGDSNTFGYGVDIKDTLPILLAQKIPYAHPYNFSIPGRGPDSVLGVMEFFPWENLIKEETGLFLFNYYDFLLERSIGEKNFSTTTNSEHPWYELNSNNEVKYRGNMSERFLTKVFIWIKSRPWLDKILPVLPRYRYGHSVFMSKVFLKMKQEYLKKFPKGRFVVVVNHFSYLIRPWRLADLIEELKANKIEYIEVLKGQKLSPEHRFGDTHLNIKGHRKEADEILKVLSLNKIIR